MSAVEITVLMPVYNGAAFLKEAIDSVLNQSYRQFEFLIINDGSTDNSEEIIHSYTDERIRYVKNERNEGLISSLNTGITLASGNYIARMDADDICLPDRLKHQLNLFHSRKDLVVAGSDYFEFDGHSSKLVSNINDSDYQKAILLFATCFAHPTTMIKNIFSAANTFYNREFVHAEDYKLWADLSFYGEFGNVSIPLLKYRRHDTQVSARHREMQHQMSSRIRREYCERLNFKLNEEQFRTLDLVGNNVFLSSSGVLAEIHDLFIFLIAENKRREAFNAGSFLKCIHQFWIEVCGHTNLGFAAYNFYKKSELAKRVSISLKEEMKLIAKCVIRKFRN